MKNLSIWLETEIILCNDLWIPSFMHKWNKTSSLLLNSLIQKYGESIKQFIKPELDSCQLEIINPKPHDTIHNAIDEIQTKLYQIITLLEQEWLFISQKPYGVISDSITHSWTSSRYTMIHDTLMQHWLEIRNSTNICWTHINLQIHDNFKQHCYISKAVKNLIENKDYQSLQMDSIRYWRYLQTVDALQHLIHLWNNTTPLWINTDIINSKLIDEQKNPYSSYELVRLKRIPSWMYLSELRTCDWPVWNDPCNDFAQKTNNVFNTLVLPHVD